MKRYTKTNSSSEFFHPAIDLLENEAYKAGYDLSVDGDDFETAIINLKAREDEDMMPKIEGWFNTKGSGDPNIIYYEFKLTYPEIRTDELKYADSLAYWTDRWNDVAKFIEWTFRNSIELDMWEEN